MYKVRFGDVIVGEKFRWPNPDSSIVTKILEKRGAYSRDNCDPGKKDGLVFAIPDCEVWVEFDPGEVIP